MADDLPTIALAGNPNVGKTSLFNRLTGADLKVGNYPGVTVERVTAVAELPSGSRARLMDVPGTYSLSARTKDEQLALQAVAGLGPHPVPDLVLMVVDATQLSRNLYLVLQVLETGVGVVVALTMTDLLARSGAELDVAALERALGVSVVAISHRGDEGLAELGSALESALADPSSARSAGRFPLEHSDALAQDLECVAGALPRAWDAGEDPRRRALAAWALLSLDADDELADIPPSLREVVAERRERAKNEERSIEEELIGGRYRWIAEQTAGAVSEPARPPRGLSERIDAVLLHPAAGFALFLLLMGVVFQSLFSGADPAIAAVEGSFGALADLVRGALPPGLLRDFLTEGLIAGVGSVVVFLPQILLLFFFIGVMEDTGYMARVAFLMDRVMRALGLHGRAFVPMMSGFACAIPAIMAARTMERRRDQLLTMMVVPLMTCSARLPIYALIIGALFPPDRVFGLMGVQGLLMVAMYLFSTLVALACAAVLGRTMIRGGCAPLLLELPPYRVPRWRNILRMMWQRSSLFLREAGGVILVCTIALWLLLSFPREPRLDTDFDARRSAVERELPAAEHAAALATIDEEERGARLRASWGGRLGRSVEPVLEPLGFDWKIGIGIVGAFAAREVFVSTLGVVYGVGEGADEETVTLREKIRRETRADGRPVYTPLTGLSLMVFFALCCQCVSTLAVVRRETHSWRWPAFLFAYMTGLAWLASFLVYQGGRLAGLG
ncbi:MAG: ferrous iron transport protein B [Planctomycetota bacterium]|jgi:ferrous iron transport protein B|nr:ferrous iron transport protein B [Planctomycetota bacterium]MDP6762668.1 ferrous iron transport protein B [Planctomycetota bacterium]MDP6989977.1 ferrous iron transport protein B [Planctomycetota bacterium]